MVRLRSGAGSRLSSICPDLSRSKPASTCCWTFPNSNQTKSSSFFCLVACFFLKFLRWRHRCGSNLRPLLLMASAGCAAARPSEPFFPLLKEEENKKIVLDCLCKLQRMVTGCTRRAASCRTRRKETVRGAALIKNQWCDVCVMLTFV